MSYWDTSLIIRSWLKYPFVRSLITLPLKITQNKVRLFEFLQQYGEPCVDLQKGRVDLRAIATFEEKKQETLSGSPLANIALDIFVPVLRKAAAAQNFRDQAIIACALELYWKKHNDYPEKLEALVPEFCAALPHDVITEEPPPISPHRGRKQAGFLPPLLRRLERRG